MGHIILVASCLSVFFAGFFWGYLAGTKVL